MGYSVRSGNVRYSQYVKFNTQKWRPQWPNNIGAIEGEGKSELYELTLDPFQTRNWIAPQDEEMAGVDATEEHYFDFLKTQFPKN